MRKTQWFVLAIFLGIILLLLGFIFDFLVLVLIFLLCTTIPIRYWFNVLELEKHYTELKKRIEKLERKEK